LELFGRGGMGEVWRAFDTETKRTVAVKLLPASAADDPVFEARFRREAEAAAGLSDPHVVPIHHFGEIDGRLYVDMRLIEGQDLEVVLAEGAMNPGRAVGFIEQVASALEAAHRIGLVHRDVKPSNILLTDNDFAYLIDFGIARTAEDSPLTNTGMMIGTWAYMAPERFTTGTTDPRSDVYALTCVLHQCLTGSPPYPGNTLEQQFAGHMSAPPPRPTDFGLHVPPALDDVIAMGMAKDAGRRFQTAKELAAAARTALDTAAVRPVPRMQPPVRGPESADQMWRSNQSVAFYPAPQPMRPAPQPVLPATRPVAPERPSVVPWWRRKPVVIGAASGLVLALVAVTAIVAVVPDAKPSGTHRSSVQTATLGGPVGQVAAKVVPSVVKLTTDSEQFQQGSGIVVSSDGLILTASHVVSAQTKITFGDGKSMTVTVVGTDPATDIAVVRADGASGLTPITMGSSAGLRVGQNVVSVGAPLGGPVTATPGVIEALDRPVTAAAGDTAVDAIQTNVGVDPGLGGGALVDMDGGLIGVSSAVFSGGGPGKSGFAIPIDLVKRIADELIAHGRATHASLGVQIDGSVYGSSGAKIVGVDGGGAAASAGLPANISITKFDGKTIDSAPALMGAVRSKAPGDKVTLTYVDASGQPQTLEVTLGVAAN
jgi:S1-C subfamily serine protease/serine/threonine protein kinase